MTVEEQIRSEETLRDIRRRIFERTINQDTWQLVRQNYREVSYITTLDLAKLIGLAITHGFIHTFPNGNPLKLFPTLLDNRAGKAKVHPLWNVFNSTNEDCIPISVPDRIRGVNAVLSAEMPVFLSPIEVLIAQGRLHLLPKLLGEVLGKDQPLEAYKAAWSESNAARNLIALACKTEDTLPTSAKAELAQINPNTRAKYLANGGRYQEAEAIATNNSWKLVTPECAKLNWEQADNTIEWMGVVRRADAQHFIPYYSKLLHDTLRTESPLNGLKIFTWLNSNALAPFYPQIRELHNSNPQFQHTDPYIDWWLQQLATLYVRYGIRSTQVRERSH